MSRRFIRVGLLLATFVAGCGAQAQGAGLAASVNGHPITLAQYNQAVWSSRQQSITTDGVDVCTVKGTAPLCAVLKRGALTQVIDTELIGEYAAAHHITVSQAEFNTAWIPTYQQQYHSSPAVLKVYATKNHTTPAQIKDQTRQTLLAQKVMYAVTAHMPLTIAAINLARIDVATPAQVSQIQAKVRNEANFEAEAKALNKQKTSLCHKEGGTCGVTGWLPESFIPAGDASIFTARAGQIVGPFAGQQIQELVLVIARNAHYHMTQPQALRRRQQLFATWLTHQEKTAKIVKYVHP